MGINLDSIKDDRLRERVRNLLFPSLPKECTRCRSEDVESELHDYAYQFFRSRGWYVIHSRMDRRATVAVGAPDFVVALPQGRVFWLEIKRSGGKPTTLQLATQKHLRNLGHRSEICYGKEELAKTLSELG